ncbi:glycosyltransferase family 2 protein [Segatella bryantii]|uniref:glycosyltransferase family 2 protein n=1 Tax=Segatella bryantii TaxID=77095 RepID=UPI0028532EE7|nr:glycosyltransferase family 2 protein [Segatella bryantii]MDR4931332.1 glycosyltransferase family 2 protein [Segatella bryantii]
MKVSIIIPAYNVEKYIEKCLTSIINQTYKNIEIIIIDDGSNDSTYSICSLFQRKDNRIKLFSIENGGVSNARNFGLTKVSGQYICFVDSDDFVEKEYIENLLTAVQGFDIAISGIHVFGSDEKYEYTNGVVEFLKSSDLKVINKDLLLSRFLFFFPWRKIFKTDIIRKNKILFDTHIKFAEDTCFCLNYLCFCSNIIIIPRTDYNYRLINTEVKYRLSKEEFDYTYSSLNKCCEKFENKHGLMLYALKLQIYRALLYCVFSQTKDSKVFKDNLTAILDINKKMEIFKVYFYMKDIKLLLSFFMMSCLPTLYLFLKNIRLNRT